MVTFTELLVTVTLTLLLLFLELKFCRVERRFEIASRAMPTPMLYVFTYVSTPCYFFPTSVYNYTLSFLIGYMYVCDGCVVLPLSEAFE